MALIEFKNLPDTSTPLSAENLNNNFNEVKVESGSNENGNWVKFADGTMICTQIIKLENVSINTSWGSLYIYAEEGEAYHYFPQVFTEIQSFSLESLNQVAYNGFWLGDYGRRKVFLDKWTGICLVRPTSTTATVDICVTAIGKWK